MHKDEVSYLFKALSDPSRVKIVKILYNNDELCAHTLLSAVDCGQSTLSHHMAILTESGIISSRKDGQKVQYSVNCELIDKLMDFVKTPCNCTEIKDDECL